MIDGLVAAAAVVVVTTFCDVRVEKLESSALREIFKY